MVWHLIFIKEVTFFDCLRQFAKMTAQRCKIKNEAGMFENKPPDPLHYVKSGEGVLFAKI
jgi:hypothetical protein